MKHESFYIIRFTDICSRFTRVFIIKNIKSSSIIKKLKKWLEVYPTPLRFLSDNGRQYISSKFKELLRKNNISHRKTAPYNPMSNGISERINSTILFILRIYKGDTLSEVIKNIEINLNFTYHSILRSSPMEFLNGYSLFDIVKRDLSEDIEKCLAREENLKREELRKLNEKKKVTTYHKCDKILRKNVVNDKILNRYMGPFEVIKVNNESGKIWIKEGRRINRHNIKNVKPFVEGGGCHTSMDIDDNPRIDQTKKSKEKKFL
ncbi:hypothetical protein DMUE_5483 [Dictyocoela muelleri]|nr:hypothetical protein DMUE_5483 [Dictyocoela muelleri]